jgi:uncharacterized membrane protein
VISADVVRALPASISLLEVFKDLKQEVTTYRWEQVALRWLILPQWDVFARPTLLASRSAPEI